MGECAQASALTAQGDAEQLRSQLTESQEALKAVTTRAESAEADVKAALSALENADKVLATAASRQETAELIGLVSTCIAAFLSAAVMTVYLLQ